MHFHPEKDETPAEFVPSFGHVIVFDGTIVQVLNDEGTDWDSAATAEEVAEVEAAIQTAADSKPTKNR